MNTVFTQQAVEGMRTRDVNDVDVERLIESVEHVSKDRETLTHSSDVIRLATSRGEEIFILRAGDMRAVLTLTPERPEEVVVVGVYRAVEAFHTGDYFVQPN